MITDKKITVVGLGYVGLPLAVEFAKKFLVVGFDINQNRIDELKKGIDRTLEVENDHLKSVLTTNAGSKTGLYITCDPSDLKDSKIYIITVPTPTDAMNKPDFTPLIKSSETIG
ncbi:MAG TPA: nucleotide sugar dehydrogenase, partial [Aquaticitalea sp.]|nr:nucleotide sugar dehydrogenase [Aquaticitalea sp.]